MSDDGDRVVLGHKGTSSSAKVQWTENRPDALNDLEYEELGAVWEGDELVTYDLDSMKQLIGCYEDDAYLPDND